MAKTQKPSKKIEKGFTELIPRSGILHVLLFSSDLQYVVEPSNFITTFQQSTLMVLLGTIYKGGVVVPIIQTLLLTVIALSIERYFAIRNAEGKGKLVKFVVKIKEALSKGDIEAAKAVCDQQKGSVGNVVLAALTNTRVEKG
jgi:biopolymer transport protein ExbB